MVKVDIQGTPDYGDDTSNSYADVEQIRINLDKDRFTIYISDDGRRIKIFQETGKMCVFPIAANAVELIVLEKVKVPLK